MITGNIHRFAIDNNLYFIYIVFYYDLDWV